MAESGVCMTDIGSVAEATVQDASAVSSSSHTPVRLKLRNPKKKTTTKKVAWTNETVDNEHMNKKKSKCCCIYEKPHVFGESSSDTDDECEHCRGHPDLKPPSKMSSDASSSGT